MLFQSIKRVNFGYFSYIKMDQSGTGSGTFSIGDGFPFVSGEGTFGFHQQLSFPSFQTIHLNKVFPFTAPQMGNPVGIGLVAVIFCQQTRYPAKVVSILFQTFLF